jgi:oligoendopeptidase F
MKENFHYGSQVPRAEIPAAPIPGGLRISLPLNLPGRQLAPSSNKKLAHIQTTSPALDDTNALLALLHKQDQLAQQVEKVYAYARLQQDAENGNAHLQALVGKAENLLALFTETFSFLEPGILALPAAIQEQILKDPRFALIILTCKICCVRQNMFYRRRRKPF